MLTKPLGSHTNQHFEIVLGETIEIILEKNYHFFKEFLEHSSRNSRKIPARDSQWELPKINRFLLRGRFTAHLHY